VAKPQIPEHAVNYRGEMKEIDNETGKVKYVDMKKPVALDFKGDVTHKRY
jgi:hypothetical protein